MINTSGPVHSFTFNKNDDRHIPYMDYLHTSWNIHRDYWYNFAVCIGVYYTTRFWFRPATPRHQPYALVSSQHAIVDDNVEAAAIYRSRGMVEERRRPHKNHVLHTE